MVHNRDLTQLNRKAVPGHREVLQDSLVPSTNMTEQAHKKALQGTDRLCATFIFIDLFRFIPHSTKLVMLKTVSNLQVAVKEQEC